MELQKRFKKLAGMTVILFLFLTQITRSEECTTGLAAPGATADQRALLWKNRDSSFRKNEVVRLKTSDVSYLGIINAEDTTQIWAGVNSHGFAIMNAEALDMAVPNESTLFDAEGVLMKTALIQCKTASDFENLLMATNVSGRAVTSNFGVIDALGNAAFFETGNHEYFRFDAADADNHFLIRANFAYKARSSEGYGRHRYERAGELFRVARNDDRLTARYIIEVVANDIFLADSIRERKNIPGGVVKTADSINRYRTVASAVFEGVRPGEDPRLTTFWITLGEPIVSLSVPLWTYAEGRPELLDGEDDALLNHEFRRLKALAYPDSLNPGQIDLSKSVEIKNALHRTQTKIFRLTGKKLRNWRKHPPEACEVAAFQEKMALMAYRVARNIR